MILAAGLGATFADSRQLAPVEIRGRRLLDDFLVAALHRTVALTQPDRVLEIVGENLDLDVARVLEKFLHVDGRIAEGSAGFGARHGHRVEQRRLGMHDTHAAAAAAAGSLDDDGITDGAGDLDDFLGVVGQGAFRSRHAGHGGSFHGILGADLVAHQADRFGTRADEDKAGFFDAFGEIGVFREKAVAGVDGLRIRYFRGGDNGRNIEIALRRRSRPDADRLVGKLDIFGFGVGLGVHDDGLDA